ncbi:murein L,D-transpeptidase catalytic domain family protein [Arenimonas sp. MALMAid1274]|uniref:murein L,D-transpeptidase catalytic domain family protein n=1 Tax=Arenimonas sp. MALMAid1274 TaxID=3411630 RepID=UPI003BA006FA
MKCLFPLLAALSLAPAASAVEPATRPAADLARSAPDADPHVIGLGLRAMRCAQARGVGPKAKRLAVIDYRLPSRKHRLWVFDVENGQLLFREPVAHGQGSGEDKPTRFSNVHGSHQSSLGLFLTDQTYHGANGYSLRMEGLEPGYNDQAMARAIVMHGAPYVDLGTAQAQGRLGRSWGCPALRPAVARPLIDEIKQGQFVFAYYPDPDWLRDSQVLHCDKAALAAP